MESGQQKVCIASGKAVAMSSAGIEMMVDLVCARGCLMRVVMEMGKRIGWKSGGC